MGFGEESVTFAQDNTDLYAFVVAALCTIFFFFFFVFIFSVAALLSFAELQITSRNRAESEL